MKRHPLESYKLDLLWLLQALHSVFWLIRVVQVTPSYVIPVLMGNNVRSSHGTCLFSSFCSFFFFSKRKFRKVEYLFLTPSRQSLNPFGWNLASFLSEFSLKTMSAIFVEVVFHISFIGSADDLSPLTCILLLEKNECVCQDSETCF